MTSPPNAANRLGSRLPAEAVFDELLRRRQLEPPRSPLRRLFGVEPLPAESRSWYRGALGELAVGNLLEQLGPEWTVLHAVPVGRGSSDIDHVVIGPSGVFTLNTKHHAGKEIWIAGRAMRVAGQPQRYIPHALHEAQRAGRLLSTATGLAVEVTGVIVLVNPGRVTVKEKPSDVTVLTDRRLLRWLRRRPVRLDQDQVARIAAAADLPTTWHQHPAAASDGAAGRKSFDALHQLVRRARCVRRIWIGTSVLAFGSLGGWLATNLPFVHG